MKICTVTSRFWKLQYRLFCHTTSQLRKLVERIGKCNSSSNHCNYAPNFEKVDGAYCFWSVRALVGAWVGHTFCTYCNF